MSAASVSVPGELRPWTVRFAEYAPVDVTPAELRPDALAEHVPEGAEPAANPGEITRAEWRRRQHEAVVPFLFDVDGWPVNPTGRTGRVGRNLKKWGENQAADPLVFAGQGEERHVLLIQRDDTGEWAMPGGMVDPGENPVRDTVARELREEAGLDLSHLKPTVLTRQYVDDHRASDHAWVATTVCVYHLADVPAIQAGDDAADARWFPAADTPSLHAGLDAISGVLHQAHAPVIALGMDHLNGHIPAVAPR